MAYQFEQLWGLVLPPHMRFLLWLMIQPEEFYHHNRTAGAGRTRPAGGGGPAGGAAEAAGEDLEGGQGIEGYNMATGVPRTGVGRSELWPLLCQELSLTQEQEDKVREVQRRLRSNKEAWAEQVRHLPAFLLVPLNCPRIMIPTYCCSHECRVRSASACLHSSRYTWSVFKWAFVTARYETCLLWLLRGVTKYVSLRRRALRSGCRRSSRC